jgi:hypothetical protein
MKLSLQINRHILDIVISFYYLDFLPNEKFQKSFLLICQFETKYFSLSQKYWNEEKKKKKKNVSIWRKVPKRFNFWHAQTKKKVKDKKDKSSSGGVSGRNCNDCDQKKRKKKEKKIAIGSSPIHLGVLTRKAAFIGNVRRNQSNICCIKQSNKHDDKLAFFEVHLSNSFLLLF